MTTQPLQTVSPDQLGERAAASEDLFSLVFSPGGALQKLAFRKLLAKLISTNLCMPTQASLAAQLAYPADSVALVFSDPTAALNGWYRKAGASGTGAWAQFEELSRSVRSAAEAARDEAVSHAQLAQGVTNFRSTLAEGLADFAVGVYFASTDTAAVGPFPNQMRLYKRTAGAPGYTDQGDVAATITKADLASPLGSKGSELVMHKPDRTGSVGRSVRKRLNSLSPSPLDFGAAGDGTTDDTVAVQAYFDSLETDGVTIGIKKRKRKGVVPSGVYRLTSPITISGTDFEIIGDGSQSTEFLIDHAAGPGFIYTGLGFSLFQGFVIRASDARKASTDSLLHGFISDPGASFTTFKLRFRDVLSLDHPGDCFRLIQPEQLLMRGCAGNRSGQGYGINVWGRNLVNICGEIIQCDAAENALNGLYVNQMAAMQVRQIRALNNRGAGGQIKIDGENNTISDVDCEAFSLIDTTTPPTGGYIGLSVTGRNNRVIGGNFYALTKGIRLLNADDCTIISPSFSGKSVSFPMAVGVSFEGGSDFNSLKLSTFSGLFVTSDYDTSGGAKNRIDQRGLTTVGDTQAFTAVEALTPGQFSTSDGGATYSYTPDASQGNVFRLVPPGPLTINFPVNLTKGQYLLFLIQQSASGAPYNLAWNSSYNARWTNRASALGVSSSIIFHATGTTILQQVAAQSPYQPEIVTQTTVAFGGTTVASGAVSGIPTTGISSAPVASGFVVTASASINLQGLRLTAWISADNVISYQFHNPTAASITIGACTLFFSVRRN